MADQIDYELVGDDFQGNRIYEVVASDLRVPLGKPFFAAAGPAANRSGPGRPRTWEESGGPATPMCTPSEGWAVSSTSTGPRGTRWTVVSRCSPTSGELHRTT